jgi:hypothetical protein
VWLKWGFVAPLRCVILVTVMGVIVWTWAEVMMNIRLIVTVTVSVYIVGRVPQFEALVACVPFPNRP